MKYLPSLVTVRDIQPRTSRAEHPIETIERMARHILAAGALARPLVVRQTGLESFELLDGELAYHAAARARELDPIQAEAVLAFIATPHNEAEILRQLEHLSPTTESPRHRTELGDDSRMLATVEHLLSQQLRHFEEYKREATLAWRDAKEELTASLPRPPKMLLLFNGENDQELGRHLQATGQKAPKLLGAIDAERRRRPFDSIHDAVKRIEGLSFERVVKMIDRCEASISLVVPDRKEAVRV